MQSGFQFTNPVLSGMLFSINKDFDREKEEIEIPNAVSVNVSKSEHGRTAIVTLICEIGAESSEMPFYIRAEEVANFRWNEEVEDKIIDKLLNQNAPSLLLSYLRPIIAQITVASPFGAYNVPFMNFTQR